MEEELRKSGFKKSPQYMSDERTNHWYKTTHHGTTTICDPDFKNYPRGLDKPVVVVFFDNTRKRQGEPTFWAELRYFLISSGRRIV